MVQLSSPPKQLSEMKKVELKRRAEAVATQRQELMIPLMQHRRFSETVAIDHRAKPQEMQVNVDRYQSVSQSINQSIFVCLTCYVIMRNIPSTLLVLTV